MGAGAGSMGPLVPDTTVLDGCAEPFNPGDKVANCDGSQTSPDAPSCAALCEANGRCSAVTWHDAGQADWALRWAS